MTEGERADGAKAAELPAEVAPAPLTAAERGEDVLEQMLEMNSAKFAAPPTKYRAGHVTARKLDAKAISKTQSGFEIKLPSGAPIATPAIHDGKLITGGGFRSKELYAFNATTGQLEWGLNLDDDGPSAPACVDNICVINTESCTVFAVAADTGDMLWSWWLGDPLASAPTIADGKVFVSYPPTGGQYTDKAEGAKPRPPGATHVLGAFDLRSGQILWQRWIDADVMSAPVAIDDELYATSFAGTVYKLDTGSGKLLSARRDRATSAPVIVGESVFYTQRAEGEGADTAEEGIALQHRESGAKRWVKGKKQAIYLDKKVQGSSSYAHESQADDAANGFGGAAPAAANPTAAHETIGQGRVSSMQSFQGSRILNVGDRNISSMGDEVVATDARDGKRLWSHKLAGDLAKSGGFLAAPPVNAGGSLLVGTLSGEVLRLNAETGAVEGTYKVGRQIRSQPVVVDGWIYVPTVDGRIVAINTHERKLTGWAMWGANPGRTGILR